MNIQFLLLHEEKLILNEINLKYKTELESVFEIPTQSIIEKINNDLCDVDNGIASRLRHWDTLQIFPKIFLKKQLDRFVLGG